MTECLPIVSAVTANTLSATLQPEYCVTKVCFVRMLQVLLFGDHLQSPWHQSPDSPPWPRGQSAHATALWLPQLTEVLCRSWPDLLAGLSTGFKDVFTGGGACPANFCSPAADLLADLLAGLSTGFKDVFTGGGACPATFCSSKKAEGKRPAMCTGESL